VTDAKRLAAALAAIDAANAEDPIACTVRGRTGPKEVMHAELVTEWVRALQPDSSEPLLLAARGSACGVAVGGAGTGAASGTLMSGGGPPTPRFC
jgi:hypothetical protein